MTTKTTPYWWEEKQDPLPNSPLPADTDILIIGTGYTGVHAALSALRAGRAVHLLDKDGLGAGCSSRNGGQIAAELKPSLAKLTKTYGQEKAVDLMQETDRAMAWVQQFIQDEEIDCDYTRCGLFVGAHKPDLLPSFEAELDAFKRAGIDTGGWVVSPQEMARELGTEAYHGGLVLPNNATLHPVKYLDGLMARVDAAGGTATGHCAARKIVRQAKGFVVETTSGPIRCAQVILATNGYADTVSRWHQRRVIPIGSYVIATEEIDQALMDELFPTNRNICDSRRVVYYYRPSPDRRRILFGGRVSLAETDPNATAPKLKGELDRLFPQLHTAAISHSWMGYVAFTFAELPFVSRQGGVYAVGGYCGSGIALSSYLGSQLGQAAAVDGPAPSNFAGIPAKTIPFYNGNPWFLSPSILAYKLMDRFF